MRRPFNRELLRGELDENPPAFAPGERIFGEGRGNLARSVANTVIPDVTRRPALLGAATSPRIMRYDNTS